jgi:hypothetical protein
MLYYPKLSTARHSNGETEKRIVLIRKIALTVVVTVFTWGIVAAHSQGVKRQATPTETAAFWNSVRTAAHAPSSESSEVRIEAGTSASAPLQSPAVIAVNGGANGGDGVREIDAYLPINFSGMIAASIFAPDGSYLNTSVYGSTACDECTWPYVMQLWNGALPWSAQSGMYRAVVYTIANNQLGMAQTTFFIYWNQTPPFMLAAVDDSENVGAQVRITGKIISATNPASGRYIAVVAGTIYVPEVTVSKSGTFSFLLPAGVYAPSGSITITVCRDTVECRTSVTDANPMLYSVNQKG